MRVNELFCVKKTGKTLWECYKIQLPQMTKLNYGPLFDGLGKSVHTILTPAYKPNVSNSVASLE